MAEDKSDIIYKTHAAEQSKFDYFLLAAVGAGLGFALSQTNDIPLGNTQWLLGGAISCWGLSFFFGCRRIYGSSGVRLTNADILRVTEGTHPISGNDPAKIAKSLEILNEMAEKKIRRSARSSQLQLWFLFAGAVSYIGWHIYEMYLRSL